MAEILKLPEPQLELTFPLMKAFSLRRSIRKWDDTQISDQHLANLLWAACGITKAETKRSKSKRTAPSATNSQEISVYAAKRDGLYLYDETEHHLLKIGSQDIRDSLGNQKMMHSAPLGLIYVADFSKLKMYLAKDRHTKDFVAGTDTAFISENVYLYCAAAGLVTVVLGLVNREKLHSLMGLAEDNKVIYTQVVGNPL